MIRQLRTRFGLFVRRSLPLTCAAMIADNILVRLWPALVSGSKPLDDPDGLAHRLVALYGAHVPLRGRFCELGPGGIDHVARKLIEHGVEAVDQADRFGVPTTSGNPRIRAFAGREAAGERFFLTHRGYDAIVSNAVLEHVRDPIAVLEAMAVALVPGGSMVHQVDLRDHGMFRDPRDFLRVPQWLWPAMTCHAGRPNRVLLHRYREAIDRLGLDYRVYVTSLFGVGEVEPAPYHELSPAARMAAYRAVRHARPLAKALRHVALEDLSVSGFLLVAYKPAPDQAEIGSAISCFGIATASARH